MKLFIPAHPVNICTDEEEKGRGWSKYLRTRHRILLLKINAIKARKYIAAGPGQNALVCFEEDGGGLGTSPVAGPELELPHEM